MQFNSLYFIIFFLPVTLAGYYLLGRVRDDTQDFGAQAQDGGTCARDSRRNLADWFLIAASLVFYGVANVWYPLMLGVMLFVNWFVSRRAGRKAWMVTGIVWNAGILGVFKYTNFFLENMNAAVGTDWPLVNLLLPLGISFIVFSQISWIVDCHRGKFEEPVSFREYVLFSVYFPKITQGPIITMREFLPQLRKAKRFYPDAQELVCGIQMFTCGLFKKVMLADPLGNAVTQYYANFSYRSNVDSLIVMLAYTLQIYMDFSGYSDMAIGISKLLGISLSANFNSPYRAGTVTDFWRRWHISLTNFLREYIYFPLGGSRKGKLRTYVNILIIFLISGLWHGANWTFVLWGLFHGLAQVAERLLGKLYRKVWLPIRWCITFYYVSMLWMLFQSSSWQEFLRFRWHLRVDKSGYYSQDLANCFHITGVRGVMSLLHLPASDAAVGTVCTALFLGGCMAVCLLLPNNQKRRYRTNAAALLVTVAMLIACLLSMSGVSTFLYNDF